MDKDTKTFINQKNYVTFLKYENIKDAFASQGYADGYADFDSNESGIIEQLHRIIATDNLIDYINFYLQGYYVGKDMSDMALEIYDEDGNFKDDEYRFVSVDCTEEAIAAIKKYTLVLN